MGTLEARWLLALIGLYAVMVLASPLLHHDLACHLKASSNCEACHASPAASRVEPQLRLGPEAMAEAGYVEFAAVRLPHAALPAALSGRAPPA